MLIRLSVIASLALLFSCSRAVQPTPSDTAAMEDDPPIGLTVYAMSYPGGVSFYFEWNKNESSLRVGEWDIPHWRPDVSAARKDATTYSMNAGLAHRPMSVANMVVRLADQKDLPDSGVGAWDGGGIHFIVKHESGRTTKRNYLNPQVHGRWMDAVAIGLYHIVAEDARLLTP